MAFTDRLHNRGSISTGYDIDNSCKFEPDNSEYLGKTPTSSGNRRTFTISMWIKRTEFGMDCYLMEAGDGDYNQSDRTLIKFDSSDKFRFGGGSSYERITNRVFRDASAWYHIVMAVDTTDSTAGNRLKLYINGVQETSFGTSADPSQNFQYAFCKDDEHTVGFNHTDNVSYFAGYMSEVILIDGQQLDPTSFGEFDEDSGIWKPIDVSGLTFGTNGFYLDFKDSSNLGNDASGGTDFTENNITAADQAVDTPTNNFATWQINNYNPTVSANFTFIEGATTPKRNSGDAHVYCVSTMAMSSGKWYMEYKVRSSSDSVYFGGTPITQFASENHNGYYLGQDGGGSIGYGAGAFLYYWTGANTQYTENRATGDIIGVALDKDNDKIAFSKNGTFMLGTNGVRTDPSTPSTMHEVQAPPYFWAFGAFTGSIQYETNMGGFTTNTPSSAESDENGYGAFEYAPPTGYYALCTKNLAEFGG